MMVSTFLMTFPNGHILYLGSWHHERHPTIVDEDENESTSPSACRKMNQWHWRIRHWGLSKVLFYMLCKRFSLKTRHIPHILYVENTFVFVNTQIYKTHLRAVKKRFKFSKGHHLNYCWWKD